MRFIKKGYGYWDVTKYPYGVSGHQGNSDGYSRGQSTGNAVNLGDFRRATEDRPILQVLEDEVGQHETRVKLLDGSIAVVKNEYIGEVQS